MASGSTAATPDMAYTSAAIAASAQTSRSSLTMRVEEDVVPVFVSPELQREITRQEARIEQYGGDDVEPPQHEKVQPPAEDPNRVAWDGPDDQLNPQNWTETRRWLITLVCSLMTVNVYVVLRIPSLLPC